MDNVQTELHLFKDAIKDFSRDELMLMSLSIQDQIAWCAAKHQISILNRLNEKLRMVSDLLAERELLEILNEHDRSDSINGK